SKPRDITMPTPRRGSTTSERGSRESSLVAIATVHRLARENPSALLLRGQTGADCGSCELAGQVVLAVQVGAGQRQARQAHQVRMGPPVWETSMQASGVLPECLDGRAVVQRRHRA